MSRICSRAVFVVQEQQRASVESDTDEVDAMMTSSENISDRDVTEMVRTEKLFVELQQLSYCRAAICSEVDLCEMPDLQEVDEHERLREGHLFQPTSAGFTPSSATFDAELALD